MRAHGKYFSCLQEIDDRKELAEIVEEHQNQINKVSEL
jgi:hypothetical protein